MCFGVFLTQQTSFSKSLGLLGFFFLEDIFHVYHKGDSMLTFTSELFIICPQILDCQRILFYNLRILLHDHTMIILYVGLSNTASPDYSQVQSFLLLPQLLCVRSLARALSLLLAQTTFHQNTDGSLIPGHLFTIKRKLQILLFHKTCRKADEGLLIDFNFSCDVCLKEKAECEELVPKHAQN